MWVLTGKVALILCSSLKLVTLLLVPAPLQAMKIDTLPNGRQLTYGAYKDCSRPLRRCLKQVGSGSVEGGIAAIKADSKALEEVSALLAVDNQVGLVLLLPYVLRCLG